MGKTIWLSYTKITKITLKNQLALIIFSQMNTYPQNPYLIKSDLEEPILSNQTSEQLNTSYSQLNRPNLYSPQPLSAQRIQNYPPAPIQPPPSTQQQYNIQPQPIKRVQQQQQPQVPRPTPPPVQPQYYIFFQTMQQRNSAQSRKQENQQVRCPNCNQMIQQPIIQRVPGSVTWTWCCCLCITTAVCCLVPFCVDQCQDIALRCENCGVGLVSVPAKCCGGND